VKTKAVSELTYDATVDLSAALLQGQCGFNLVLRTVVRENLFPKVKFIHKDVDLAFDGAISGSIFKWMNLENNSQEFKLKLWAANGKNVDTYLTQHRNNKIKKFKRLAKSKYISIFLISKTITNSTIIEFKTDNPEEILLLIRFEIMKIMKIT